MLSSLLFSLLSSRLPLSSSSHICCCSPKPSRTGMHAHSASLLLHVHVRHQEHQEVKHMRKCDLLLFPTFFSCFFPFLALALLQVIVQRRSESADILLPFLSPFATLSSFNQAVTSLERDMQERLLSERWKETHTHES